LLEIQNNKIYLTYLLELQIGIWDDRKVFGTRIESLKDGIFGDNPPIFDHSGNNNNSNPSSNPLNSKVGRKDSSTVLKVSYLLSYATLLFVWKHIELDMRVLTSC
jgi:hypothetical protein